MEIQLEPEFWQSSHNNQIGEFSCWRCTLHQDSDGSLQTQQETKLFCKIAKMKQTYRDMMIGKFQYFN